MRLLVKVLRPKRGRDRRDALVAKAGRRRPSGGDASVTVDLRLPSSSMLRGSGNENLSLRGEVPGVQGEF